MLVIDEDGLLGARLEPSNGADLNLACASSTFVVTPGASAGCALVHASARLYTCTRMENWRPGRDCQNSAEQWVTEICPSLFVMLF
jgi:hypothetical protein